MVEQTNLTDIETEFRSQLRQVALPLLIGAAEIDNLALIQSIIEIINGPLDHIDLIRAAMDGKTFAAGMTDTESRQKLFEQTNRLINLANLKQ